MSEKVFCYHCRNYHLRDQVRLVQTKTGKRWRCVKSLSASRASSEARDAFGEAVRQANKSLVTAQHAVAMPHCVLDVLRQSQASEQGGMQT